MNMRTKRTHENKILVDIDELASMLSVGKNSAEKIGIDAGAVARIGRRKLYSVQRIKEYIEELRKEQNGEAH